MGGDRHTMVPLVSPASSTTQIPRGVVMIGAHAGMMGGARTPTPGAGTPGGARRLLLLLRLSGVSAGGGLVTSAGNRLRFGGRLSAAGANDVPVSIDAPVSQSSLPVQRRVGVGLTRGVAENWGAATCGATWAVRSCSRVPTRPCRAQWRRGERPVKRV